MLARQSGSVYIRSVCFDSELYDCTLEAFWSLVNVLGSLWESDQAHLFQMVERERALALYIVVSAVFQAIV